ncbi:MAG TPA: hypothetical protein VD886_09475 [Herpetosiphonaceae bacterium]|nr:hypothetical protein [Herpetosiphonaceae bacterium]
MGDINQELFAIQHQLKTWRQQKAIAKRSRIIGVSGDAYADSGAAAIDQADRAIAQALDAWQRLAGERYRSVTGAER